MIGQIVDFIGMILMVFGSILILLASIGVVRMPDVYLRMSASTKAATVGAASLLLAAAFHFDGADTLAQMALTILFLLLTAPVGAHIIGRAAYKKGAKLYERTVSDELEPYYDDKKHR